MRRTSARGPLVPRQAHWLIVGVAGLTLLRLVMAALVPLAPDEAYYWVWSRALAPGYLDHPPMVALWIRAGTALLGRTALGVRLFGPLSAALASWLLFDTSLRLFPRKTAASAPGVVARGSDGPCAAVPSGATVGMSAVLLLNASLFLGVGSVIMTPDTPLLFFWTATLWAAARVAAGGSGLWWLAAGCFAGLALDSKYTALFLWVGIGLWALLVPAVRPWLARWQPYAACGIGLLLFSPVVLWNAGRHWAGFIRQGGRVGDWQPLRAVSFLSELIGGQIALATPVIWLLCMIGLAVAVKRARRRRDPVWSLLAALSLPPALVFLQHALGDRVQGNWPAIIYVALAVAAGAVVKGRGWTRAASGLGFGLTLLVYEQATLGLVPVPPRLDPIALRLTGWDGLARATEASATAGAVAFVAAEGYALASELAWSMPGPIVIVGADDRWRLTALPAADIAGRPGLLVRDARRQDPPDPAAWTVLRQLDDAVRPGSGAPGFAVYRVVATGRAPAVALPR